MYSTKETFLLVILMEQMSVIDPEHMGYTPPILLHYYIHFCQNYPSEKMLKFGKNWSTLSPKSKIIIMAIINIYIISIALINNVIYLQAYPYCYRKSPWIREKNGVFRVTRYYLFVSTLIKIDQNIFFNNIPVYNS